MSEHAKFAPSGMGRLMQCPGSYTLAAKYPQEATEASIEGTLAHAVAAAKLKSEPLLDFKDADVTDEMIEYADQYYNHVVPDQATMVEEYVDCSAIHPDCWGTPDVYKIKREIKLVMLWDYKFGYRPVEVKNNWQLITYALGIKTMLKLSDDWSFQLGIYQPRAAHRDGPYRRITLTGAELMAYLPRIKEGILAAWEPNAVCKVGDYCLYCPAAAHCQTLGAVAGSILDWVHYTNQPFDLAPAFESAELFKLNRAVDLLKARITGIEQSVIGGLKAGKQGYGHMLEQGVGREAWSCSIEEVKQLGNLFSVVTVVEKPITPKQAIAKKIPAEIVRTKTKIPFRDMKLVPLSNLFD